MIAIRTEEHALRGLSPSDDPLPAFQTAAAARSALERDFGVVVSDRGDAAWTTERLSQVYVGFALLDPAERESLRGIEVIRSHHVPPSIADESGGLFETHTATREGKRARPPAITLYDRAFNAASTPTTRGPATQRWLMPLLREVGHAISEEPRARAIVADNAALDRVREASEALNHSLPALRRATVEANLERARFNHEAHGVRLLRAELDAHNTFAAASTRISAALMRLNTAHSAQAMERAHIELDRAIRNRDEALRAIAEEHAIREAAVRFAEAHDRAVTASRRSAALRANVFAARTAQSKTRRAVAALTRHGHSARLLAFARMMRRSRERPVTPYGAMGTPEAFADALMLYRTDPTYLRRNRPATFRWFEQGNHLR